MSLLEKASDGSFSDNEVKIDDFNKIDSFELGENFNYDKEFEVLEQMALESKASKTLIQKLMTFEFELHLKNKKHMVYLLGAFSAAAGLLSGLINQSSQVPVLE